MARTLVRLLALPLLSPRLLALPLLVLGSGFCEAGPTDVDPPQTLEVREVEPNQSWVRRIDEQYRELSRQMESLSDKPMLSLSDVQAINAAHKLTVQIDRIAGRLIDIREPAGVDMHLRVGAHLAKIKEFVAQLKSESDFSSFQAKLSREYVAEARKREKGLAKIKVLVKQGKWDEAEQALNDEQDDLEAGKLWLDDSIATPVLTKFAEVRREVVDRVRKNYLEQNEASLRAAIGENKPNLKQESQALQRAAQALRTTPETTYHGKSYTGPQLLAAAIDHWTELQRQVIRYEVNYWYLKRARDASVEQEYEAFRTQLGALVADAIAADAERAAPEEARPLYMAYLDAVAPLVARSFDDKLHDLLRLGFDPLLDKSPELKAEVDGYEQATNGILAWRQRTAEAYAKSRRKEYSELVANYSAASRNITPLRGLFTTTLKPGSLYDPADRLMQAVAPQMINKKVLLLSVDGSRGSNQATFSRLQGSCYASLLLSKMPPAALNLLKSDLLVSEEHPPLSLRAAAAIWGVENGCIEEIGAEITAMEFQALAPRSLKVEPGDSFLVHSAEIATQEFIEPERQLITRFEVHPVWYRFRYQFVGQ